MQLCGIVKKVQKYDDLNRYSVVAALLLLVFFTITISQLVHHHQNIPFKDTEDYTQKISSTEDCSICDYVLHKENKQIHHQYSYQLKPAAVNAVTLDVAFYIGNYEFTLQGFTNKGPPISIV